MMTNSWLASPNELGEITSASFTGRRDQADESKPYRVGQSFEDPCEKFGIGIGKWSCREGRTTHLDLKISHGLIVADRKTY